MRTYSLYSQLNEMPIAFFEKFDRVQIKQTIVKHLNENKTDTLELCREYDKQNIKRHYGNEILQFFEVNKKNDKPSLCILRGVKTYYKTLSDEQTISTPKESVCG